MTLRRKLYRRLLHAAQNGDSVALGWLNLITMRSEKELFSRAIALLKKFLQDNPFCYHRNAGALAIAAWIAQNHRLILPQDFHERYKALLEEALRLVPIRRTCVLLDAAQIYLIAHALPEELKPAIISLLKQEQWGLPYRRIIFTEALRLHDPCISRPAFDLDRLDVQDLIALCWQQTLAGRYNDRLFAQVQQAIKHYQPEYPQGPALHLFLEAMLFEVLVLREKQHEL